MALIPAYAVDGGAGPAFMFRTALWASTSGANGIVLPWDLKVSALATPGGAVNITPGGALISAYAATGRAQSYAAYNDATTSLTIPATGSGAGRTDYIILRIDDWHYDGSQAPASPLTALYCSFQRVSSITGLAYPFIPLAKVTIPASTGTITNAMITDLRQVAIPMQQRVLRVKEHVASQTESLTNTTASGEYWPNSGGQQLVDIPSWATTVIVRADWHQIYLPAGNVTANIWIEYGDWTGTRFELNGTEKFAINSPQTGGDMRQTVSAVGQAAVPAKYRGRTNVTFQAKGQLTSAAAGPKPRVDDMTGFSLDLLFLGTADPSTS